MCPPRQRQPRSSASSPSTRRGLLDETGEGPRMVFDGVIKVMDRIHKAQLNAESAAMMRASIQAQEAMLLAEYQAFLQQQIYAQRMQAEALPMLPAWASALGFEHRPASLGELKKRFREI